MSFFVHADNSENRLVALQSEEDISYSAVTVELIGYIDFDNLFSDELGLTYSDTDEFWEALGAVEEEFGITLAALHLITVDSAIQYVKIKNQNEAWNNYIEASIEESTDNDGYFKVDLASPQCMGDDFARLFYNWGNSGTIYYCDAEKKIPTEGVCGEWIMIGEIEFGMPSDVVIIQKALSSTVANKTALEKAISSVTDVNDPDYREYYHSNDRYNGKSGEDGYNINGFWADMQSKLTDAQTVYAKEDATQSEVDSAANALQAAIDNLIPRSQINATALYEAAHKTYLYWRSGQMDVTVLTSAQGGSEATADNCTETSWKAYEKALAAVETELGKLFDTTGEAILSYNDSDNEEAVENVNAAISAFNTAVAGLDQKGTEYDLSTGRLAYDSLRALTSKMFHPSLLTESDYSEGWGSFIAARDKAIQFLGSHDRPMEGAGIKESQVIRDAYGAFIAATYEGLKGKAGTARLEIVDRYALMTEGVGVSDYAGVYSVTIPEGGITIGEALSNALGAGYNLNAVHGAEKGISIYVNNAAIYRLDKVTTGTAPVSSTYEGIQLHDGDRVVVAMLKMPSYGNLSGALIIENYAEVYGELRSTGFRQKDAATGEDVSVEELAITSGEEAALKAVYVFAAEAVYNGAELPLSGAKVLISKVCTSRAEAMKAAATEDSGVVTGSDGSFSISLPSAIGSSEGWYALNLLAADESAGLANGESLIIHVTDPSDLSALKATLKTQLEEVYTAFEDSFYSKTQLEMIQSINSTGISGITNAKFSGEAEEAYQTACDAIQAIQEANEAALNVNLAAVRNLLEQLPTAADLAAGKLYDLDKPFLDLLFASEGWYTRMTEYQRSCLIADETELLAALQKAWTDSNQGASLQAFPVYTVKVETRDADNGALLNLPVATAGWIDSWATIGMNDQGSITYQDYARLDVTLDGSGTFILPSGRWYKVTFVPGVKTEDRGDYSPVDSNYGLTTDIDFHYRADKTYEDANVDVFNPIRKDAVMTLYLRLTDEVAVAKTAALAELETAFRSYDRSKYSDDGWQALNAAYLAGQTAINAAAAVEAVDEAKADALDAMHDVPERVGLGSVYVTVRNDTYPTSKGAPWDGALVDRKEVPLNDSSTMMSCIVEALQLQDYAVAGAETNYISSINGLKEFDGGRQSGWMGCLNDWFVNEGFANFGVENGNLHDGDVISVEYTCAFGGDIRAGTETNHDTSLYLLTLTNGTLTPKFDSAVTEYVFTLNSGVSSTKISFSGNNRAFQARAYLNGYAPTANNWIRSGDTVTVSGGDVITVGVGEGAWPAMGTGVPTKYKVTIASPNDPSAVVKLINAIGSVTYSNYKDKQAAVDLAKAAYEALTDTAKQNVTNYATLTAAEDAIKGFQMVDELKAEIAKLPRTIKDTNEVRAAVNSANTKYCKLTTAQKNLLTVAESNKLQKAVNTLTLIDELKAIDATKDFISTEANTEADVMAALRTWLTGQTSAKDEDVIISITGFTDADSSRDGSYTATVTFKLGESGAQAATQEKTISGTIKRSSDAGVSKIVINGKTTASGSGTSWTATLPYGSDPTKATFAITAAEKATPSAPVMAKTDGSEWTFIVTAEDGTKKDYTVKLSVSEVKLTVLDSNVYDVSDDTVVTALSPVAVSGLDAIVADDLDLPEGTKEASVWLMLKIKTQSSDELTLAVTAWYAADGKEADKIPDNVLKNVELTLTVPLAGTEYAKVLYDSAYLDAKGSSSGIAFDLAAAGDYTLIPDAHIAIVTFHEFDGTNNRQIVFYRGDAGKALPEASKSGAAFKGWYAKVDCTGDKYTTVSATLPTDLYPLWSYGVKTEEVGDIEDRVEVSAIVQGDVATITVESKKPCAVIVEKPDGSFERLEVVNKNADGSYDFVQEDYDADMVFYVAALGDYDENGTLEPADLTAANLTIIGDVDLEPLSAFIMGAKDGKLRTVDLAKLFLHLARNDVEW